MKYVVGFVIPYYCNSKESEIYFKRLMSVLAPLINKNKKAILCIVEDGKVSDFLDEYENKRIIVLRNEKNSGVSFARNRAINRLINECLYLSFIDSDDMISDNYIDRLVEYCQDNTHDIIETNANINYTLVGEMPKDKHRNSVWGYAIKSCVIGNKRFEKNKQIGEDTKFMLDVVDLTKHRKKYCDCIYYYQFGVNPKSLIKRYNNKEISKER